MTPHDPHAADASHSPPVTTEESYRLCCRLARRAAKNFYYAFWTLPRNKRRSMCALYAFFRRTDDLGDDEPSLVVQGLEVTASNLDEARRSALRAWRASLRRAMTGSFDDRLLPAVVDTVRRYKIPVEYLETAIDGVESDLDRSTFATFDELAHYCHQVASVVGLACVHVWGFRPEPEAFEAAHACGVAFQMTNILRDVAEDASRGRIYLPQEDLERFGVSAGAIRAGVVNNAWRALMQFQADRIEVFYRKARELTPYLEPDGVRIYGAMTDIYYGLFQEIRRRDGDVFSSRVRLSTWRKLSILVSHWRPWRRSGACEGRTVGKDGTAVSEGAKKAGKPIDGAAVRGGAG
jgi:15-cis-phytoene synthase